MGLEREVTPSKSDTCRKGVDHGLEAKVNLSGADDLGDILGRSEPLSKSLAVDATLTLGSLGSKRATLIPSSAK